MFNLHQTRACFSLSTLDGLFEEDRDESERPSHAALFGHFAVGIDPAYAPDLGILPVIHYYDYEPGDLNDGLNSLSPYLIDRLVEIRSLLSILAHVKAIAHPELPYTFDRAKLSEMEIVPHYEPKVERLLASLDRDFGRRMFQFFDTDRVPVWNLVESIDVLLSLFQTAHSRVRHRFLAYYQQREWRLIQHNTRTSVLYCLGEKSWVDREDDPSTIAKKLAFRKALEPVLTHAPNLRESLGSCWVLESTGNHHIRDYISQIVAPARCLTDLRAIARDQLFAEGAKWEESLAGLRHNYVVLSRMDRSS
jgi:hypothetical protein